MLFTCAHSIGFSSARGPIGKEDAVASLVLHKLRYLGLHHLLVHLLLCGVLSKDTGDWEDPALDNHLVAINRPPSCHFFSVAQGSQPDTNSEVSCRSTKHHSLLQRPVHRLIFGQIVEEFCRNWLFINAVFPTPETWLIVELSSPIRLDMSFLIV